MQNFEMRCIKINFTVVLVSFGAETGKKRRAKKRIKLSQTNAHRKTLEEFRLGFNQHSVKQIKSYQHLTFVARKET